MYPYDPAVSSWEVRVGYDLGGQVPSQTVFGCTAIHVCMWVDIYIYIYMYIYSILYTDLW